MSPNVGLHEKWRDGLISLLRLQLERIPQQPESCLRDGVTTTGTSSLGGYGRRYSQVAAMLAFHGFAVIAISR